MASSRQSNGCLLRQVRVCLAKDARVVLADGCALWLRAVAETVALAADADTQLHKTMREVQRRIAHSTREREHAQICDLFQSIDTDGSGRLEWAEVSEGAAKLGAGSKAGQEQLRLLFSQVADEWREVDRKQFDFLLSSLKAAQQFGSAYVLEAAEVMQTMRRELDRVQALRRAPVPGTLPGAEAPGTSERSAGKLKYAANTSTVALGGRGGAAMLDRPWAASQRGSRVPAGIPGVDEREPEAEPAGVSRHCGGA